MRICFTILSFICSTVFALAQTQADFTAPTTKGCSPITVRFQDASSGNIVSFYWTFGNGNTSTQKNPAAIFYKPGFYDVSLTVTDNTGKTSTVTKTGYVEVFEPPTADFTMSKTKGCEPLSVNFTNSSKPGSSALATTTWDFGDGNTLTSNNASHVYSKSGTYSVSILVIDKNGCQSKITKTSAIEVLAKPDINISADNTFDCTPPLVVNFKDLTKYAGTGSTYSWDFGDGSTSTSQNPSHTYTSKGSFTVTLTVTNADGCVSTRTFPAYINIDEIKPDFTVSKTEGCEPLEVIFTDKTTPNASGLTYMWDLGNGSTPQTKNAKTTYGAGKYTVSLTVSKGGKCGNKITKYNEITVYKKPDVQVSVNKKRTCEQPFTVSFTDNGTGSFSYNWYVDGIPRSNTKSGTYTLTKSGTYQFTLIGKNEFGCPDTAYEFVTIDDLIPDIFADVEEGCAPLTVNFTNNSEYLGYKMSLQSWDFGDGGKENISDTTQLSTTHTFTKKGVYTVKLKITTPEGCQGFAEKTIRVGKKWEPNIDSTLDTVCNLEAFQIKNLTNIAFKDSLTALHWKLYSNSTSTDTAITSKISNGHGEWDFNMKEHHLEKGYYNIRLITEDNGCFDTFIRAKRIYVNPPLAKLAALHDTCSNDTIKLRSFSKDYDSINWTVNGKWYSNNTHIELNPKNVSGPIILSAFNGKSGCIDTVKFVYTPKPTFPNGFSKYGDVCTPATINLKASATEDYLQFRWVVDGKDTTFGSKLNLFYDQPGKHVVEYVALDISVTGGCKKTTIDTLIVAGPTVDGDFVGKPACGPVSTQLINKSNPADFVKLYWEIGTNQIPITQKGTMNYDFYQPGPDSGGFWKVSLIGVDKNGCIGRKDFKMQVFGVEKAKIKVSRFQDCSGRKFIFKTDIPANVNDSNWTYLWDFGDGTQKANQKTVNYVFAEPGKYNVRLYITNENGCVTRPEEIIDIDNEALRAKFYADSLVKDCPPLHVQFEDRSTLNNLRRIVKWEWDFGDGSTSTERYPKKLYLESGSYNVKLKVTDEWGCVDSIEYPGFILVKGPLATYTFDKNNGCVPLTVNFTADTSRASSFSWDFGDGTVINNNLKIAHTYKDTGRFIPLLTVKNQYGCTYTAPPIDTIYVHPNPFPDFELTKPCINQASVFTNLTKAQNGSTFTWNFGDGNTSTESAPQHTYLNPGTYPVKMTVLTNKGCKADTIKQISLKDIKADFESLSKKVCVGSMLSVLDKSRADNGVMSWRWMINDTFEYYGQNPRIQTTNVGPVKIQLAITDNLGCKDSILDINKIKVGDTLPPPPTSLLRVSVMDDYSYLVDFNKSNIPDFDCYHIFHNDGEIAKITDPNETRFEFTNLNTLHNVYCSKIAVENTCGIFSDLLADSNDCTVEVSAKGELNQSRLNWNAYHGWDEVEKYYIYREDKNRDYVLLDSVAGNVYEYIDTNILCYQKHRYKILAKEYYGNNQISWSDTCEATPIYVNSLPPNELVRATVEFDDYIRLEWLPTPYSKMPIDHYIVEKSGDGNNYSQIKNNIPAGTLYIEDKKVEVDSQPYFYRVRAVDVCKDQAPYSNLAKTILLHADTGKYQRPWLNWTKYQGWDDGVSFYEIQRKEPDGTFFSMGYSDGADDTIFNDKETPLNERPSFCYRIIGYKNMPNDTAPQIVSVSNEDCIWVSSWLWVPNAFSPNGDNLNDYFVTPGWYIKEYHIAIYNRWGEKVFESNSLYQSWDGKYKGEVVENEAFVYIINSIGIDNVKRDYKGTVTVIR
ncbi:MAG: PKD domain-containing protein [Flavobacteriales bacterium]|nr:PKD domain-containing protein [Flavobacteriales bacterium]